MEFSLPNIAPYGRFTEKIAEHRNEIGSISSERLDLAMDRLELMFDILDIENVLKLQNLTDNFREEVEDLLQRKRDEREDVVKVLAICENAIEYHENLIEELEKQARKERQEPEWKLFGFSEISVEARKHFGFEKNENY